MQTTHLFQCARVLAFSCLIFLLASPGAGAFQKPPQPDYSIPIDFTIRIQSKTKKPIKTARTFDSTIVQVHDVLNDPTSIFLKGIGEGTALVELISADQDEAPEQLTIYVIRQQSPATNLKHIQEATFDLKHLKKVLEDAFPKTKLEVSPITSDSVYIRGEVASPDDMVSALHLASKIIDPRYMEKAAEQKAGTYDIEFNNKKLVTVSSRVINGLRIRGGRTEPEPVPDLNHLRKVLEEAFPKTKLEVTPIGTDSVYISGEVASPDDMASALHLASKIIDPLYLEKGDGKKVGTHDIEFQGRKLVTVSAKVINGLRVRGVPTEIKPLHVPGSPPQTTYDAVYLKKLFNQVVPDARLDVIPAGHDSVIISGFVTRAEDVVTIMSVASNVVDPNFFNNQSTAYPGPTDPNGSGQAANNPSANAPATPNQGNQGPNRNSSPKVINAIRVAGLQQVQLDVVVAQVSRSEFRQLGFNFISDKNSSFIASTLGGLTKAPSGGSGGSTTGPTGAAIGFVNSLPNTNVPFGVLSSSSRFLGFLQALRTENASKLLAEPKLVTSSGKDATFLVGGRQAVLSGASGVNGPGAAFEEVGTDLRFLPIVLGNGKIQLEVQPRVRSVNNALGINTSFGFVPGFDDKRVTATVEMEAGQTLVIGGLIQNETQGTTVKIPVLGDLPFLGVLFSTKEFREVEQEVVVLVTPHLVDPQSCDQVNKLLPGMETRSPDDFELFLEGILEAPRGPRKVMQNRRYTPAFKNAAPLDFESGESRVPGYPLIPSAEVDGEKSPATLPKPTMGKAPTPGKPGSEKPDYTLGKIDVVFPTPAPGSPVK